MTEHKTHYGPITTNKPADWWWRLLTPQEVSARLGVSLTILRNRSSDVDRIIKEGIQQSYGKHDEV